jgi:hypothetical protein
VLVELRMLWLLPRFLHLVSAVTVLAYCLCAIGATDTAEETTRLVTLGQLTRTTPVDGVRAFRNLPLRNVSARSLIERAPTTSKVLREGDSGQFSYALSKSSAPSPLNQRAMYAAERVQHDIIPALRH